MTIMKTKKGIADKLRSIISTVKVDLFGYEEKINTQMNCYFQELSRQTNIPINRLAIYIEPQSLGMRLFYHTNPLRVITDQELIKFFSGAERISGLEDQIKEKIRSFLIQYAKEKKQDVDELTLKVHIEKEKVQVHVLNQKGVSEELPISHLIKVIKG